MGENVDMERADWNNMAWDRDMWRAFNRVMSLKGPRNEGHFWFF
jgi:hypothetical protein